MGQMVMSLIQYVQVPRAVRQQHWVGWWASYNLFVFGIANSGACVTLCQALSKHLLLRQGTKGVVESGATEAVVEQYHRRTLVRSCVLLAVSTPFWSAVLTHMLPF